MDCLGPVRHHHVVTAFDRRDGGKCSATVTLGHALRKHLNSAVALLSLEGKLDGGTTEGDMKVW